MKIQYNGIEYTIREDKGHLKKTNEYGVLNYSESEIIIDKELKDDVKLNTILHELVHTIFFSEGYNNLATDETLVQNVANALHQIIPQIKHLFKENDK